MGVENPGIPCANSLRLPEGTAFPADELSAGESGTVKEVPHLNNLVEREVDAAMRGGAIYCFLK